MNKWDVKKVAIRLMGKGAPKGKKNKENRKSIKKEKGRGISLDMR